MSKKTLTTPDFSDSATFTRAADEFGNRNDGYEHELTHVQAYFHAAFKLLTPGQRRKFLSEKSVRESLTASGVEPPGAHDKVPVGTPGVLMSKCGELITGTNERIFGTTGISSVTRNADGTLEIVGDGETDIRWDDQETVTRDGQIEFVTDAGLIFLESEVIIVTDPEDEGEDE